LRGFGFWGGSEYNQLNEMRSDKRVVLVILLTAAMMPGCFLGENQKLKKLDRLLSSGKRAMAEKRYDEAVRIYDEGLALAPGESSFLVNKSLALRMRGIDRFNASIKLADEQSRLSGIGAAKQDFSRSADISTEAIKRIKSSRIREYVEILTNDSDRLLAFASHAEAMRFAASYVDKTKAPEALEAIHEYIDIEPDEQRKTKARLDAGKMLLETGYGDRALDEYKKVLDTNPDDVEALLGAGLALSQTGVDKQFMEAEPYFQRFVDLAPAGHRMKAEIEETLKYMRSKKR
jgi:tetratricopeptide (TPR) repeat protein